MRLSMIAPDEWGRSKKFQKYIAKVNLLADHTWDVLDATEGLFDNGEVDGETDGE